MIPLLLRKQQRALAPRSPPAGQTRFAAPESKLLSLFVKPSQLKDESRVLLDGMRPQVCGCSRTRWRKVERVERFLGTGTVRLLRFPGNALTRAMYCVIASR